MSSFHKARNQNFRADRFSLACAHSTLDECAFRMGDVLSFCAVCGRISDVEETAM